MDFRDLNLDKPITQSRLSLLESKGYNTVEKFVRIVPRGYYDYSKESDLRECVNGKRYAFHLLMTNCVRKMGAKVPYVRCEFESLDKKNKLSAIWFDKYQYDKLSEFKNKEVAVAGLVTVNEMGIQIVNPDMCVPYTKDAFRIYPIYKKIAGMSTDYFQNLLNHCIDEYKGNEIFTEDFKKAFHVVDEDLMIKGIHRPSNVDEIKNAMNRIIMETMYPFCQVMVSLSEDARKTSNIIPQKLDLCNKIIESLPYELTKDQKDILNQFVISARKGKRVNALVQGDVGSGKTICAILLMVSIVNNGYQAVLMAPTGILAKQHYEEIKEMLEPLGIHVVFMSGGMKQSEKNKVLKEISDGTADVIIGTHSVISEKVEFKNLGITIVDEEHKFGVLQRECLKKKANEGVHNISMSATPIPRSLAQTIYGDTVDVYSIESMPKGRMPIKTATVHETNSMFNFMKEEIEHGHQCYMVCPLIENSNSGDDKKKPYSVEEVLKMAEGYFCNTDTKIGCITGKMKDEEKEEIKQKFKNNEYQILIATTIIEVGINVPNATVICIMNAERFGLAGLHQLRGRVGRNSLQSYCILYSEDKDNPRLDVMCKTSNGFEIAEEDLKLRGTGDIIGIKQSGEDESIGLMLKYPKLYKAMREYIKANKLY